ncbi:MAG TPA: hypothetical protein VEF04_16180, partial [Blastocatellia bacterium]|nr:hypothetical protein [Blastocatellia bacterium]
STQTQAIQWVKDNLAPDDTIIIDAYAYVDLHDPAASPHVFENAEIFWKVQDDPIIRYGQFNNDWRTADYVMLTHEMSRQLLYNTQPLLKEILEHVEPIAIFTNSPVPDDVSLATFFQTHQAAAAILKVNKDEPDTTE